MEPNGPNNASSPSLQIFSVCIRMHSSHYHIIAFILISVPFVLPLCLYTLYLGAQQWRSRARISHTDFFTYNTAITHFIGIVGSSLLTLDMIFRDNLLTKTAMYLYLINSATITLFQIIACFDRYTAVVYPVTYLVLKSQTWALVRNVCTVVVWLWCIAQSYVVLELVNKAQYFLFAVLCFSCGLILVVLCNIRILCVLIHPGPGDGAKGNKSKQRAFHTISAITATLLVKFLGDLLSLICFTLKELDIQTSCALFFSSVWFTLPSSLVLPLLFVHRNHKMPCFKSK